MEDAIDAPAATDTAATCNMQAAICNIHTAPTEATPKMSNVKTAKPFSLFTAKTKKTQRA